MRKIKKGKPARSTIKNGRHPQLSAISFSREERNQQKLSMTIGQRLDVFFIGKKYGVHAKSKIFISTRVILLTSIRHQMKKLKQCPKKPNCICSEYTDEANYIEPLYQGSEFELIWQLLAREILTMGGNIETIEEDYLHATFKSKLFGFVDDVEFKLDRKERTIHLRSESRTGYYDFSVNRKRIARLQNNIKSRDK